MVVKVSLLSGAVASDGVLSIQTNGTTEAISISTGQVATFANNPILTGGTANGVAYLNGSKALTTGSALVFDGTNLGVGVTPSAWAFSGQSAFQVKNASFAGYQNRAYVGANNYTNSSGNSIYIASDFATNYIQTSGQHQWYTAVSGTANNTISFTQAMTLDASGNLTVPAKIFTSQVNGDGTNDFALLSNNASKGIVFYTGVGGVSAVERARIDSSGNLLVGKQVTTYTTDGASISKTGSNFSYTSGAVIAVNRNGTDGTAIEFYKTGTYVGNISVTGSITTFNSISDYRLKENVAPMIGALDTVAKLKPCTYTWKSDGSKGQGFIAHELQEVVSDCVTGEKDAMRVEQYEISPAVAATFDEEGNELTPTVEAVMGEREAPSYQGIDTSFLVATLVAAIQELKAEFDAYKAAHP